MQLQSLILSVSTLAMSVGALDLSNLADTNRYIPGPYTDFTGKMDFDPHGAQVLGEDGVLRSFAGNGTVVDYHQLDPSQVKAYWEDMDVGHQKQVPTPSGLVEYPKPPSVDGRLVTDLNELLYPADKPAFTKRGFTSRNVGSPSAVFERQTGQGNLEHCQDQGCYTVSMCQGDEFIDHCSRCWYRSPRDSHGLCRH